MCEYAALHYLHSVEVRAIAEESKPPFSAGGTLTLATLTLLLNLHIYL